MADSPQVALAKEKLRELVPVAVETLAELLDSQADGIRLGASKEILDRGGVPARAEQTHVIDIALDQEIEGMIRSIVRGRGQGGAEEGDIEDAEVVEEGEGVARKRPATELALMERRGRAAAGGGGRENTPSPGQRLPESAGEAVRSAAQQQTSALP